MGQTDLEVLLEMGFEKARAELAVKKTGGCRPPPPSPHHCVLMGKQCRVP